MLRVKGRALRLAEPEAEEEEPDSTVEEFERGILLETFCGTTGYASPEMLLCEKYLGPGTFYRCHEHRI